jgi:hypothetical protein
VKAVLAGGDHRCLSGAAFKMGAAARLATRSGRRKLSATERFLAPG